MVAETEEEQIEAIKKWFEDNGLSLVVTIVLALGGTFGYRAWENSVRETAEAASAVYEDLVTAVGGDAALSEEMRQTGETLANQLKTEYADSTYATFAALQMAKVAVDRDDLDGAAEELKWALDNGASGSFEVIARIRLAKVLSQQNKDEEALGVLQTETTLGKHVITWEETRGDILYKLRRMDAAREAYQIAVNSVGDEQRPFLEMKLQDITYAQSTDRVPETEDPEAQAESVDEEEG